jgi:hypothetical protein
MNYLSFSILFYWLRVQVTPHPATRHVNTPVTYTLSGKNIPPSVLKLPECTPIVTAHASLFLHHKKNYNFQLLTSKLLASDGKTNDSEKRLVTKHATNYSNKSTN